MEACFGNPLIYVFDHWWQISLMIFGCAFAIFLADVTGLNRPWPLSVILGGILAQLIMDAYPCAWLILGDYTIIPTWAVMACMVYFLPGALPPKATAAARSVWDYFEDVDAEQAPASPTKKGDSSWVN